MTKTSIFIERAKAGLDELGVELNELETKVAAAGAEADEWSTNQVSKLKKDLENAKTEMESIAGRFEAEGEASIEHAKEKAERHWDALQAAVKAYRGHLEKPAAK